jgi:thiamine biosynthesis lipoprotein
MRGLKWLVYGLILPSAALFSGCETKEPIVTTGFSMDAPYSVTIKKGSADSLSAVESYLSKCDEFYSAYNENSLLYNLNKNKSVKLRDNEKDFAQIIKLGKEYSLKYSGIFDITVRPVTKLWDFKSGSPKLPDSAGISGNTKLIDARNIEITEEGDSQIILANNAEVDLGAAAKGYSADKVAEILEASGVQAVIDIGGTVKSTVKKPITVGITSPNGNGLLCSFEMDGLSVSTSGSYQRNFTYDGKLYHHIINPKTGYPAQNGIISVSVINKSAAVCDILSTAFFVMGMSDAVKDIKSIESDTGAIFVTTENEVYITGGVKGFKLLNDDYKLKGIQ